MTHAACGWRKRFQIHFPSLALFLVCILGTIAFLGYNYNHSTLLSQHWLIPFQLLFCERIFPPTCGLLIITTAHLSSLVLSITRTGFILYFNCRDRAYQYNYIYIYFLSPWFKFPILFLFLTESSYSWHAQISHSLQAILFNQRNYLSLKVASFTITALAMTLAKVVKMRQSPIKLLQRKDPLD